MHLPMNRWNEMWLQVTRSIAPRTLRECRKAAAAWYFEVAVIWHDPSEVTIEIMVASGSPKWTSSICHILIFFYLWSHHLDPRVLKFVVEVSAIQLPGASGSGVREGPVWLRVVRATPWTATWRCRGASPEVPAKLRAPWIEPKETSAVCTTAS